MSRRAFLVWVLVQAVYVSLLLVAARFNPGDLHPAAIVALVAVLGIYAAGSARAGWLLWNEHGDYRHYVSLAIRVTPMVAMLGTAAGFLIAFSGDVADVQQRVAGASTGIVSTVVGVACTIVLMLQRHLLDEV